MISAGDIVYVIQYTWTHRASELFKQSKCSSHAEDATRLAKVIGDKKSLTQGGMA